MPKPPNDDESASTQERLLAAVLRMEERVERLEARLQPVLELIDQAPAAVATASDIADDLVARKGDVDERLRAALHLVDRLSEPSTLRAMQKAVDLLDDAPQLAAVAGDLFDASVARIPDFDERLRRGLALLDAISRPEMLSAAQSAVNIAAQAPDMAATAGDILDAWAKRVAESGVDMGRLVEVLQEFAQGMLRLATAPEVQRFLESAMLHPETVGTLSAAAQALAQTNAAPKRKLGAFGAFRALSDPDVQTALGFGLTFAKTFGQSLATSPTQASLTSRSSS